VCNKVKQGLFDIGVVEKIDPSSPADADFQAWTKLVADCLAETYDEPASLRPMNLAHGVLGNVSRPDGRPSAEDVGAAYGVFRLILRLTTEEKIQEPRPPDLASDISMIVQQVSAAIDNALAGIPAPPSVPLGGNVSVSSIIDALIKTAEWAAQVAAAVAEAVLDFLAGVVTAAATVVSDGIKYVLYLLNKALFALYRAIRDVLVIHAYSVPYTDDLEGFVYGIDLSTLWRSLGNAAPVVYPHEELVAERTFFPSTYNPALPLTTPTELPAVPIAAPYTALSLMSTHAAANLTPTLPDDFIDAPLGPDNMFRKNAPQKKTTVTLNGKVVETFENKPKNFGGAIANSMRGIDLAQAGFPVGTALPDYNLDGDRGYAWPCWDVEKPPHMQGTKVVADEPLAPDAQANGGAGVATVHAVRVLR
jgi:hypothetical protein